MIEGGGGSCFPAEQGKAIHRCRDVLPGQLERDASIELRIVSDEHVAHPAAAEPLNEDVVPQLFADHGAFWLMAWLPPSGGRLFVRGSHGISSSDRKGRECALAALAASGFWSAAVPD